MNRSQQNRLAKKDFIDEARLLMRVVFNGGDELLPKCLDTETVHAHARRFAQRMARYRTGYAPVLHKFLQENLPQQRPAAVVYPFGGGDLISALLAFPNAPELTTLSLELAGAPCDLDALNHEDLLQSLRHLNARIGGMLSVGSNTSENLSESQQNLLPVQVISFLTALAIHGYEPVAMYYFLLKNDGTIRHLSEADILEQKNGVADHLISTWRRPKFSPAFANVEIRYKRANHSEAPTQIFRHIAANLHNGQFANNVPLQKHLAAKGQVCGLVKGASYHLWRNGYSLIRNCMLTHMPFIVSDSTGIPLEFSTAAGFSVTTFGKFRGSFLRADAAHNEAFRALWEKNPHVKMPSRFGYVDSADQAHMMLSIREGPANSGAKCFDG